MRGHVRKRGKTWAVVYDEARDGHGKRKQRWKSGYRTREDAENALADIIVRLAQGAYVEPTKQTVGSFLDEWLETVEATLRPSTTRGWSTSTLSRGSVPCPCRKRPEGI